MKIQKIDESSALKSGQLVVTWSEWRFLSFVPFPDPEPAAGNSNSTTTAGIRCREPSARSAL
ncbi:MAG: hypothetical protein JOZ08_15195 [Verrucomicrobia bacterium]|nr:hypothetical protein [Verrucomicrobiota bacterium]